MSGLQFTPELWSAIALTLRLAFVTSLALLAIGLPLAHWLNTSRMRGIIFVETLVSLPIVLPPTVIGFYLLTLFSPQHGVGAAWSSVFGHPLPFSFAGLVAGSVLYSLPFAVQPFAASFSAVDPRLLAASQTLGASRIRTFFRIILPLSLSGLVTGIALSFAHTMGEFGVVLMVGGNIPGVTRTVSIDIYDKVQALNYSGANATALVLLAIFFIHLSPVALDVPPDGGGDVVRIDARQRIGRGDDLTKWKLGR